MKYILIPLFLFLVSCDDIFQDEDEIYKLAYSSCIDTTGIYQICTMDIEGNNRKQLTNMPKSCIRPVCSPDKENILFLSDYDVYVIKKDGTGLKQVSPDGYGIGSLGLYSPSWSADGKKIFYLSGGKFIVTINIDNDKIDIVPFDGCGWYADFSYNDDKVVFIGYSHGNLCTMNIDGTNVKYLTDDNMWCWWPQWSVYNDYIAFRNSFGGIKLVIMDTLGTIIKSMPSIIGRLKWSPNGSKILFDGNYHNGGYSDNSSVFIYDLMTDSTTNLNDIIGENLIEPESTCGVDWSSDGNYILYHTRTNPVQIVVIDLINNKQKRIFSEYNNKYATFGPK